MMRKSLTMKIFVAIVAVALAGAGFSFAGGDCCKKDKTGAAAAVKAGKDGAHCQLSSVHNVAKTAELTDKGAVVTFEGKNENAVKHLRSHLGNHEKGESCADCPMDMDGVETTVKLTKKGGIVTLTGSSEETVKKIQAWAENPSSCCGEGARV